MEVRALRWGAVQMRKCVPPLKTGKAKSDNQRTCDRLLSSRPVLS